ncbi:uncharacterized protein [Arachis hypogaea]|uniref:uncharacterized protein n=1 Tax=Arachis hypogaea TaxID=3818 RepID=UPI003B228762
MAWAIELSQNDLHYEPKHAIKVQAMVDFLVEVVGDPSEDTSIWWKLHVDGASNQAFGGAGIILRISAGVTSEQSVKFDFSGKERNGRPPVKSNKHKARDRKPILDPGADKGIIGNPLCDISDEPPSWIDPILSFLENGELPEGEQGARTVRRKATKYVAKQGQLYKWELNQPLLNCLRPDQTDYVLSEVHEGCCGHHIEKKALARKLIRAGYYWPSLMSDAQEFVRKCKKCQENANFHNSPAMELSSMLASRPFAQWRIDLLGPFPVGPEQVKYLIGPIDYYTKWIEAELTVPQSSTGETPFRLTYGVDAVIPVEIEEPSPRLLFGGVEEGLEKDLIDETRQMAHLIETTLKQRVALRYNAKVLKRSFELGDLVLRRNDIGLLTPGKGKLTAN